MGCSAPPLKISRSSPGQGNNRLFLSCFFWISFKHVKGRPSRKPLEWCEVNSLVHRHANQTYLDLNDSRPGFVKLLSQKESLNCDSPRKFAFSFLVDNVHISCMIMLLLRTGLIGITVYKQIQGQLNSSGGTQLCTMWACYDWKGINSFQKELSSSVIRSYNLCFLLTRRRKAKSAQKETTPKCPEMSRSITQSTFEGMLVHCTLSPVLCFFRRPM